MIKNKIKVLGIDPGTKYIGFALLENEKLIHFGVKTILRMQALQETLKEGKKIVSRAHR